MAIVQAGLETQNLQHQHAEWVKEAEENMARLVNGQHQFMAEKRRLEQARSEIAMFKASQNDQLKKVLMTFAGGSTTAMLQTVLQAWSGEIKKINVENTIYEEYRERIEKAEARVMAAMADQVKSVSGIIGKKFAVSQQTILAEMFNCWKHQHEEIKAEKAAADEVDAMKARLQECSDAKRSRVMQVMQRVGGKAESALRTLCFQEWVAFSAECKRNREFEDQVKAAEAEMKRVMKEKSNGARTVLSKMAGATDTGLLHSVLGVWSQWAKEESRSNELRKLSASNDAKRARLGTCAKESAFRLLERACVHRTRMLYSRVLAMWRLDCAIEKLLRHHGFKIDAKRQQLHGVQQMFRTFAQQLETNIRGCQDGEDYSLRSDRVPKKARSYLGSNSQHTSSLPDIHSQDSRHAYQGAGRNMGQAQSRAGDSSWR
jgi:hypothetical protein